MTNYIKDATDRLTAAHFSDNEDAIREADEMETRGFGYNANEINEAVEEYKVTLAKGDERELREAAEKEELESQRAEADRLHKEQLESEKKALEEQQERIRIEQEQKEIALQNELKEVNSKGILDRIFDIRFRPTFDSKTAEQERDQLNTILDNKQTEKTVRKENSVNTKQLSPEAKKVLTTNLQKMTYVKDYYKKLGKNVGSAELDKTKNYLENVFRRLEEDLIATGSYDNYKGMSHEEFLALPNKSESSTRSKMPPVNIDGDKKEQIQPKIEHKEDTVQLTGPNNSKS
jgi:hypothetical protein